MSMGGEDDRMIRFYSLRREEMRWEIFQARRQRIQMPPSSIRTRRSSTASFGAGVSTSECLWRLWLKLHRRGGLRASFRALLEGP